MSEWLNLFRTVNARLNELFFQKEANSYLKYLHSIDSRLPSARIVIDLGSGSVGLESYLTRLKENRIRAVAVDNHFEGIATNPSLWKVAADAEFLPFRDHTVDLICASCFFEHVENPQRVLSECYRVLKKGGTVVFYTPHRRSYVASIARMTPLWFHRWIRSLQTGEPLEMGEVCKTFYKMNTSYDLKRLSGSFQIQFLEKCIGAPSYTTFLFPPIHFLFMILHKVIQLVPSLRISFGESLIGCLVKPGHGS